MMKKITEKEMYEVIKSIVAGEEVEVSAEEIIAFCDKKLTALENKAAKAKEKAEAKKTEADVMSEEILKVLSADEFMSIADITAALPEELEATVAKVTYRVSRVLKGKVEKGDVVIPASETSKKRTISGYKLIATEE